MPQKEHLQPLEMLRAALMHKLIPQSLHHSIEHCKRPAPFEDPLRRFHRAPARAGSGPRPTRNSRRQNCSAAAFLRAQAILFVGDKELQGSQQKGPEPPLLRVGAIEISPFEHAQEEVLREILRPIGRIPTPGADRRTTDTSSLRTGKARADRASLPLWIAGRDH